MADTGSGRYEYERGMLEWRWEAHRPPKAKKVWGKMKNIGGFKEEF